LLRHDNTELGKNAEAREMALIPMKETESIMPLRIPNYTDFLQQRGAYNNRRCPAVIAHWANIQLAAAHF